MVIATYFLSALNESPVKKKETEKFRQQVMHGLVFMSQTNFGHLMKFTQCSISFRHRADDKGTKKPIY